MENIDLSLLGNRIRTRRKLLKLNQSELAAMCGVSTAYIGHIERGTRSPSVECLLGLCTALTVNPDFILQDYLADLPIAHFSEADADALERIAQLIREPAVPWPDKK